jgi:hypothetical protein
VSSLIFSAFFGRHSVKNWHDFSEGFSWQCVSFERVIHLRVCFCVFACMLVCVHAFVCVYVCVRTCFKRDYFTFCKNFLCAHAHACVGNTVLMGECAHIRGSVYKCMYVCMYVCMHVIECLMPFSCSP